MLVILQAMLPFAPQLLADTLSAAPAPASQAAQSRVSSAPKVTVNRTVPKVQPPNTDIQFSANPTDKEITRAHIFDEPLQPMRATSVQDNQDLANALTAFLHRSGSDDVAAITQFLDNHPQSPWRASLLTELGLIYRHTGWFSKALTSWEEAWKLAKSSTDAATKLVADRAVAELLELNARLGRYDRLEELFGEIQGRALSSALSEQVAGARAGLWLMRNRPENAFRCGPMALGEIRAFQNPGIGTDPLIMTSRSTLQGISLSSVCDLAAELGMKYQMAKRQPGSQVILPAVVNWKVGHYAALVKMENGRYLVQDPTFGSEIWISQAALDAEASGYFLVPAGDLPPGWSPVDAEEGKTVWGKGTTTSNDPNHTKNTDPQNPPCPPIGQVPMAQYNFMAMLVSLHIMDTPVGYSPPRGPDVHFQVTYNQREANQPTTFSYSNLGQKWTFNWLSYIADDPTHPGGNVNYYVQGGGTQYYPGSSYNSTTKTYAADPDTHGTLQIVSPTNYTRFLPDGSRQIFSVPNAPITATSRKVFLSQVMDASSNTLTFSYDSNYRLVAATDALGQVTTLSYGSTNANDPLFYQITEVTDPFERSAHFEYNTNGQLAKITDIIGITSQFTYGTNDVGTMDFITSLTTPYGTTTFAEGVNGRNRWLQATDPLGQTERQEFVDTSSSSVITDFGKTPPTTISGPAPNYLIYRNSFYWNKKAMQLYPSDYTKAHIDHWLHGSDTAPNDINSCSGILESSKDALEGRIWNTYPGQSAGDTYQPGTNNLPSAVARVLDDGSSQIYRYQYNLYGKPTLVTDPTNRVTGFIYDTNNIDLLQMYQKVSATSSNVLGSFTYNAAHLPLTAVDAAGQTNFFGYNAYGQLTALTNALGQTVTMAYDADGYLTNILGSLPGSTTAFTYDDYGRVRTVTDSEGNSITTSYDAADRATNVTYLDGSYEQVVYNYLDPVLTRDRNGHWTAMQYDSLRHLTDTYDNGGHHTQFGWCGCGSLESITDPLGRVTSWIRDLQGRVTTKINPDLTQIISAYETNSSRLKSVTDAKNQTTLYSYFIDNNLKQVTYSNAVVATPSVSFTYDTNYNRLLTMTDGIGVTAYSYCAVTNGQLGAGMLASVDGPLANDTITYAYDALGRITNRAINGVGQTAGYDALGRVTVWTNALGTFSNAYVGATGLIATNFAPFGKQTVFRYLNTAHDQRLQTIWNKNTDGSTLSQFDYAYDALGNITNWTQQAGTTATNVWSAQYDPVNQLLAVTARGNSLAGAILKQYAYGYDLAGNRTSEQIGSGTGVSPVAISQSTYNNANQLTSRTGGSGPMQFAGSLDEPGMVTVAGNAATMNNFTTNFTGYANVTNGTNVIPITATDYSNNSRTNKYQIVVTNTVGSQTLAFDLNGNMTNDGAGISYEYDAANRTTAINRGTTNRTEFAYDGVGRMAQVIEKTNGVAYVTNKYVWCGTELCEERDSAGATVTKRFFGEGEQINGTNYYFTSDHLGSIREMTDSAGVVQARYDYDPYGRRTKISGSMDADFGFTGHFMLASQPETTLTLYRLYRADLGRWNSKDPSGENNGLNLYAYVFNSPLNFADPSGLGISSLDTPEGAMVMAWALGQGVQAAVNVAKEAGTQLGSRCFSASSLASAAINGAADHAVGNAIAVMAGGAIGKAIGAAIGAVVSKAIPSVAVKSAESSILQSILALAKPTTGHPNQVMTTLEDGTRVLFRKDFGAKAHELPGLFKGAGKIDHYNIEVQSATGKTIKNVHIIPDGKGGFILQ
jgi:RHS repeat-associated protein